jgi:hypothetical protein
MISFPQGKTIYLRHPKPATMKNAFLFSLLILVFASGCRELGGRRVRGSGHIVSDSRSAAGFNSIDVGGAIEVHVKQDSSTSVRIEADDNLLEYIEIYTDNSTLVIRTQHRVWLKPSKKIKVYVGNPMYREFEVSGASDIYSDNQITSTETVRVGISGASVGKLEIDAPKISVDVTGASNLTMRGRTRDLDAGASGACEIKCFDLLTENTNIEASGASSAEVYASVKLDGNASGASHIKYKGNATTSISTSGASGVNKVN